MNHNSKKSPLAFYAVMTVLAVIGIAGVTTYFIRPELFAFVAKSAEAAATEKKPAEQHSPSVGEEPSLVRMSEQACANLGLCVESCKLQTYWRKIQTTGVVVDRPGVTDRGVTSPVVGVVTKVHAFEGDIVRPGDKLFTLNLISEHLQHTQTSLFTALGEIEIAKKEIARIRKLTNAGVIPEKRVIKLNQEIQRQVIQVDALRQELASRGLNKEQLRQIETGKFVRSIDVVAPGEVTEKPAEPRLSDASPSQNSNPLQDTLYELQELKSELGQQVKLGELLAVLANHNYLFINGHAFKKEAGNISRAAEREWDVEVEFIEDDSSEWPELEHGFQIQHLANAIDQASRTFDFFIPLTNQSRSYQRNGRTFVVWRFRPGQRVRIHVPVDKFEDVIVVPNDAVVSEGPEFYVFQQNGEFYNRIAVRVLHRDRLNTVIANDGSVLPGFVLAKNSAASLNRVLKVQSATGQNAGNFHVHADGSVHANH